MTTTAEKIAALKAKLTHTSNIWNPKPGDSLIGTIEGLQSSIGEVNERAQLLIRDENDVVTATSYTPTLKWHVDEAGAKKGDLVAITFTGLDPFKHREYRLIKAD